MKKTIYTLLLVVGLIAFHHTAGAKGQQIPESQVWLSTLSDLRNAQPQTNEIINLMGLATSADGNGGTYTWNATSTAADDGFLTIAVSGITTGRWVRVGNANTIKGTGVFGGVSLQTAYTVGYGQTLPFIPAQVYIQATSSNAAALSYITNITNTGFTVNFLTVPVLGTNNITFSWLVIKQ